MDQSQPEQATIEETRSVEMTETGERLNVPLIVFVVTSVVFLVYIAFGSIEARIWRFGRLNFEDRSIRHVWSYFGDRLPELPGQSLVSGLYWMGLAVIVIGTVAGLWLFLGTRDEDPSSETHASAPEHPASHE